MSDNCSKGVAVVTGATGAIGRAITLKLASEGYVVCVHYCTQTDSAKQIIKKIRHKGGEAFAVGADISKLNEVKNLFDKAASNNPTLSILINNASISKDAPIGTLTEQKLCQTVDIDLLGTYRCIAQAAKFMIRSGRGVIVNIGSLSAEMPRYGQVAYAMAKSGLVGLTRAAALELARFGIRVNLVAPGPVIGGMSNKFIRLKREELIKKIPLGGFPTPDDIGDCVAWLCSDNAAWITGQTISIDAGLSLTNSMTSVLKRI